MLIWAATTELSKTGEQKFTCLTSTGWKAQVKDVNTSLCDESAIPSFSFEFRLFVA